MLKLRLPLDVDQYERVVAISSAKSVSAFDAAIDIWRLGLAAAEAGWRPQEVTDRDLVVVIVGAAKDATSA